MDHNSVDVTPLNGAHAAGPVNGQVAGSQSGSVLRRMVPVDQVLVQRLQKRVGARRGKALAEFRAQGKAIPKGEDARQHTEDILTSVLRAHEQEVVEDGGQPLEKEEWDRLEAALKAQLFGAGNLEQLLDDPDVEDIAINGWANVLVTYADGTKEQVPPIASSDKELEEIVKTISSHDGLSTRPFDTINYSITLRLPDGSRLHAVQGVAPFVSISIRKHRHKRATLLPVPGLKARELEEGVPLSLRTKDLFSEGTVDYELAAFLSALVRSRQNLMIAGATSAGKTTMLRALASEIDPLERLVTVERSIELGLHEDEARHIDVVPLEERLANVEGKGAVGMADLVRNSLRMNPSRVIVGEVLGDEVITMLNAMAQGNDGSLSTIHANSSRDVVDKIRTYALQAEERLPFEATNGLIATSLHFIVFMRRIRLVDGTQRRVVESIREITGHADGIVKTTELWAFNKATQRTEFTRKAIMREEALREVGWDPDADYTRAPTSHGTESEGEAWI